ncbi:hypothetical protein ABIF86_000387 [Bradyrhizobium japonicum]
MAQKLPFPRAAVRADAMQEDRRYGLGRIGQPGLGIDVFQAQVVIIVSMMAARSGPRRLPAKLQLAPVAFSDVLLDAGQLDELRSACALAAIASACSRASRSACNAARALARSDGRSSGLDIMRSLNQIKPQIQTTKRYPTRVRR